MATEQGRECFTDHPAHESFEQAFRGRVSGCVRTCECGVTYWDAFNRGYDWEKGELESLEKDPTAKGLDHSVGTVEFEGRVYVDGCTCWHPRALRILTFLLGHDEAIAEFLSCEKRRKTREAECSPVVRG